MARAKENPHPANVRPNGAPATKTASIGIGIFRLGAEVFNQDDKRKTKQQQQPLSRHIQSERVAEHPIHSRCQSKAEEQKHHQRIVAQ